LWNKLQHDVVKQQIDQTGKHTNHKEFDELFLQRWKRADSVV
jgi:hypothetical protein